MNRYRIFFRMDGDVVVEAESDEEARKAFAELSPQYLTGQTYCETPEIDDICDEGAA